MGWHWIALFLGLVAPWFFTRRAMLVTFYRGPVVGLTCWLLIASVTTPIAFGLVWLVGNVVR